MKKLKVLNPFDQTEIGSVELLGEENIERLLSRAYSLHKNQSNKIPTHKRIKILKNVAHLMSKEFEQLALLIASEGGKPLIDARIEVARAIDGVETCAHDLSNIIGKEIPMGLTQSGANKTAFSIREPIGPVVAVSAFNHPLNLIVHQVAPAIAVGCPVIVKPADDTPLCCQKFVKLLFEAGLPEEWVSFAPCEIPVAEKLVTDPRVAFFSFIGSAKVGWYLKSKLAPGTRFALEHGGAAPVIVCPSADIDDMLPKLIKGGFYHSGQVCVSVQRVFVVDGSARALAEKLSLSAEKLVVGNATDESTQCGPLIRPREVDRVMNWVDEAVGFGAEALCGGIKLSNTTYAPTVLLNPDQSQKVSTSEIFGPVICIYDCKSNEEAILRANSLDFAFQSAVFSNDLKESMFFFKNLDSSAVMFNDHTAFRVDWMPFAGRRQSGYGIGGIGYTMEDMTQVKMAVIG
ncbi:MAG: aldehyde dehydrogenase [Betaproteobacteria bacterium TMED156]|nr:MAG: aldehyde dehydrogenase [Betaproteobacteria bacterium TMED156]